jgi:hypothetical protein
MINYLDEESSVGISPDRWDSRPNMYSDYPKTRLIGTSYNYRWFSTDWYIVDSFVMNHFRTKTVAAVKRQ